MKDKETGLTLAKIVAVSKLLDKMNKDAIIEQQNTLIKKLFYRIRHLKWACYVLNKMF
jgi:hypothetical protein